MRLLFTPSLIFFYIQLSAQCPTGLKVDYGSYIETPVLTSLNSENLPEAASLKPYCPKPGNQLNHLTSAGWATAYYASTILYARNSGLVDVNSISQKAFAPTYTHYATHKEKTDCSVPISIKESLDVLAGDGVPYFIDYPYFCSDEKPGLIKKSRISGYTRVFNSYDQAEEKITKMKEALSQGLPVVIALQTSSSFCEPGQLWSPSKPQGPGEHHAICIIGYDDNKYDGSFELINSWGKDWGNNGFIHVPYQNLLDRIKEAYTVYLIPDSQEFRLRMDASSSYGTEMPVEAYKPGVYRFTRGYGSGYRFKYDLQTDFCGYLYLYYFNDRGENGLLFPLNESVTGILPFDVSDIQLPGNDRFIQLDSHPGKETMVIILSTSNLTKDQISQKLEATPNKNLKFDPNKLQFTGKIDADQPIAIIRIELDHI